MVKKSALGRGMDSIFLDNSSDSTEKTSTLRLSEIEPRRNQPRKVFESEALSQLADSIAVNGLIQPIVVRAQETNGFYQIIAGERRWRAAKMAGLTEVPVVILEADDKKTAEYALIENIQREDLNPIEEAMGYKTLIEEHDLTQEQVAKQVGKSRSTITNSMRILELPNDVLELVSEKSLSAGHARTLLGITDKSKISEAANEVINKDLSVRATEELVRKINSLGSLIDKDSSPHDEVEKQYYNQLAKKISKSIGCNVKISHKSDKKAITLTCGDTDKLTELIRRIVGNDEANNIL